jgi:hypothetical protein
MTTNNTLPESCKWKLILHYDVEDAYFEITNGKIIIAASEESIGWETFEEAEVAAQKIVDALNQSDIEFHSENPLEIQLHIESEEWKAKYNEAIEKIKRMELFEVNVQAGMPENEASFQAGYTCGHDAADQKWKVKYDELKAQSGAVWVKGEYDWLYDQLKAEPEKNIVAYIDYSFLNGRAYRDIKTIRGSTMEFVSRGHGYGLGMDVDKQRFILLCLEKNVEWLDESGTIDWQGGEYQQLAVMYDHLLQHLKAVGIEQQRLQSENATLKEFATQKADQYANLITQAERMKKALEEIATQRTCAEVEADEDIPIGSDGSRLGDVEMAYDMCIQTAREALGAKENGYINPIDESF